MPKTILVVEDEKPLAAAINAKLKLSNFAVITVQTVIKALEHLKNEPKIDAIWLDHYLLGKEDGLDLVFKIRNGEAKYRKIPIFVVSNTASEQKVNSYLELEVSKYYIKAEYSLRDIIADIETALSKT